MLQLTPPRTAILVLIISLLAAPVLGYSQDQARNAALEISALEADLLRLSLLAHDLLEGKEDPIEPFAATRGRIVSRLDYFDQSLPHRHQAREALDRFQMACRNLLASSEVIASRTQLIRDLRSETDLFNERIPMFSVRADELLHSLAERKAEHADLLSAHRMQVLLGRASARVPTLLAGDAEAIAAGDTLQRDMDMLGRALEQMRHKQAGDAGTATELERTIIAELTQIHAEMHAISARIVPAVGDLVRLMEHGRKLRIELDALARSAQGLVTDLR